MEVSNEFCKDCPVFDTSKHRDNMIENNICPKRNMVGCPRE